MRQPISELGRDYFFILQRLNKMVQQGNSRQGDKWAKSRESPLTGTRVSASKSVSTGTWGGQPAPGAIIFS